jgi:hypothetical protein
VHEAPRGRVESVSSMERAAVVPKEKIADTPLLPEGEARLRGMRPEFIEQRFALRKL